MPKFRLIDNTKTEDVTIHIRSDLAAWAKETKTDLNVLVTNALVDLHDDWARREQLKLNRAKFLSRTKKP